MELVLSVNGRLARRSEFGLLLKLGFGRSNWRFRAPPGLEYV